MVSEARRAPFPNLAGRLPTGVASLVGLALVALLLVWLATILVKTPSQF